MQRHGCEYEFLYSFLVHTYNNLRHCRVEQSQFNFESLFAFWHSFNWFDHFENAGAVAAIAIATQLPQWKRSTKGLLITL